MTALVVLICISVALASGFLVGFFWAWRSGQFDDTHTPAWRAIMNDIESKKQIPKETPSEQRNKGAVA